MPYLSVSDFKIGMDRRRPQMVGVPGSLWTLKNALISRGGDIVRARKFDATYTLPASTFGFYSLKGQLYVFGSAVAPTMPPQVQYQRLTASGSMTAVLDVQAFDGKVYVIAEFDNGGVYHFYDGTRVSSWNALAQPSKADVARRLAKKVDTLAAVSAQAVGDNVLISAATPGSGFVISGSMVDADVIAHAETRATATITVTGGGGDTITDITVNGTSLIQDSASAVSPIVWTNDNAMATALASAINANTSDHGYSAVAVANVVTVTAAAGTGATPNGYIVSGAFFTAGLLAFTNMVGGINVATAPDLTVTTLQANVAAVAEVQATGTIEVTGGTSAPGVNRVRQITVNGHSLMDARIDWATSNTATALRVSNSINNQTSIHGYVATVVGPIITITAATGTGATPNGDVVLVITDGNVTTLSADISGGVDAVEPVAQISKVTLTGDITRSDTFTVSFTGGDVLVMGLAAIMGTTVLVHKRRMWSLVGSLLRYCKLGDPTNWATTTPVETGAGFLNISSDSDGAQDLVALGVYQGNLAIFARNEITIYSVSTDMSADGFQGYVETVGNTGTGSPRSITAFGNTDLFYLDEGMRSLRARTGTNAAYKSDIGEAIDAFVQDIFADTDENAVDRAQGIIDVKDGRFMLVIGQKILVYSYYPDSKIFAWSYLDFEADIDDIVRSNRDIYIRSGDVLYRYGGLTGAVYPDDDEFEAVAETSFMDARDPAAQKLLQGFDMACEGEWLVEVMVDPNNLAAVVEVGRISRFTYNLPKIELPGHTSHFAFRFTCSTAGYASLSSMAIGYAKGMAA